jgi:hypothetical protein
MLISNVLRSVESLIAVRENSQAVKKSETLKWKNTLKPVIRMKIMVQTTPQ